MSTLKQRLAKGDLLLGTIVSMATPEIPEILSQAGFDWLFIDGEHAPLNAADIQLLIQTAGNTPCLVRISSIDEIAIKKSLDAGAAGIIAPQVNTAEQAERAVSYSKYPPVGQRGVGISRAHGYGFAFQEHLQRANNEIVVVVQAEHSEAVDNIDAIAAVPGIDAVFVGPYDLSASLGKMGQVEDAVVIAAVDRINKACSAADIPLGIFGISSEAVRPYVERGYTLIAASTDTLLLGQGARDLLARLR
ncbi:MAG: 2,4-dihydroxyhept-2-ene-1,7-dioic acid aldolase [Gammaproteobacteria bacterium]|nr:MAG: 2,4-dihydroxyhept-2-ene-1,7-dioic acid aldolase [Gammaproteobacteria bacterium]RLA49094.1 MAG: 2,4-dihydroxyhept-2-ene-1,7-dioic acid aldolase [Gammaproteobacteria bacterium]